MSTAERIINEAVTRINAKVDELQGESRLPLSDDVDTRLHRLLDESMSRASSLRVTEATMHISSQGDGKITLLDANDRPVPMTQERESQLCADLLQGKYESAAEMVAYTLKAAEKIANMRVALLRAIGEIARDSERWQSAEPDPAHVMASAALMHKYLHDLHACNNLLDDVVNCYDDKGRTKSDR